MLRLFPEIGGGKPALLEEGKKMRGALLLLTTMVAALIVASGVAPAANVIPCPGAPLRRTD
jgi:hypothetical protein